MGYVTEQFPGRLVAAETEIAPGGNSVLSHIDVVCPDDTLDATILAALAHMANAAELRENPVVKACSLSGAVVTIGFGLNIGIEEHAVPEFQALRAGIEELLRTKQAPAWTGEARDPLTILVTQTEDSVSFRVDEESKHPLSTSRQPMSLPLAVVSIDYETLEDFGRAHGQLLRHILPAITGVSLEALAAEGGVQVVDSTSKRVVWLWPMRTQG